MLLSPSIRVRARCNVAESHETMTQMRRRIQDNRDFHLPHVDGSARLPGHPNLLRSARVAERSSINPDMPPAEDSACDNVHGDPIHAIMAQ
jgi:hypothetical protein